MTPEQLKRRTKDFALRVIRVVSALPRGGPTDVISRQLLRASTSVGANYRAACRARSPAEFASKIAIVEEEADESAYWLELLIESKLVSDEVACSLLTEASELTGIAAASRRTARASISANRQSRIGNRQSV